MLWTPANSWNFSVSNAETASVTAGTAFTPGNNTKGTSVSMITGANLAFDTYWMEIWFNSVAVSAAVSDTLADIMIDPTGGTTYVALISNLMASCAKDRTGAGQRYFFPLLVKAGAQIAVRGAQNKATPTTGQCIIRLFGKPSNPAGVRYGTNVVSYGATTASSSGTAVTPGTSNAAGTYVSLGATSADHWWWQTGYGLNQATAADKVYKGTLAIGNTSETRITDNDWVGETSGEELNHVNQYLPHFVKSGSTMYGRMTCDSAPTTGHSMMAYGLS